MLLDNHIKGRFGGSLQAELAQQYAFTLFCILDCVPADLRAHQWDRGAISMEFSDLTRGGIIVGGGEQMKNPEFWDELITAFVTKRKVVDKALQAQIIARAVDQ